MTLLVFSTPVIAWIKFIGGGQAGKVGAGEKPKAGKSIHNDTNSSIVFSVGHRNSHSQPGRPRQSLAVV